MFWLPAFVALLLRYGSLSPRSPHYAQLRKLHLQGLEPYLPEGKIAHYISPPPSNWRSFAALLKSSVHQPAGHLFHPDRHLYYIRIPKSGSSSLSKAMLQARFPGLPTLTSTQINFLCDAWIEKGIEEEKLKQAVGFTAVRHPLQRLVSVYRDFFEYPRDEYFIYHGYLFNILPQQLSFEELVRRISKIPQQLLDPHLRPQYLFLRPYQRRKLKVKVFKLEETDMLEAFLKENNLLFCHENRSAESYDYRDYFTPSVRKLAQQVYAYDYQVFGYVH